MKKLVAAGSPQSHWRGVFVIFSKDSSNLFELSNIRSRLEGSITRSSSPLKSSLATDCVSEGLEVVEYSYG